MSQYHNISHIYVSQMWQWQPSPQISGVISALCAGCCRAEIQFATAQMGEAIASVPQYHMQKCLVCFNTDKADIFRGVSQTIPMKEQSPIWQCSLSKILSVMLNENWRDKTFSVCISVLIKAVPWALLDISKTSPRRVGPFKKGKPCTLCSSSKFINISSRFDAIQKQFMYSSRGYKYGI